MTFADVEAMMIAFLKPVAGVPVSTRVPNPRPSTFIRLWRNGGPARNRIVDRPMVTIDAYADNTVEASALLLKCRDALLSDYTRMPLVRGVWEITGPYYQPDTDSGAERYRFSVQMSVRAPRS